ncbi:hypothetical protein ABB37_05212 [Leptomonas pyrrhocoris]|uniref:Uncharacterized protein n=1 Tax=Leptomonas pyrrhocoris TaxID=157538 RepID=A0A0N0VF57_LEPPY|nr:hypothetical protein ABB37_05212 [Leptomonas pyrrhocoris]KPA80244.1 hypothetical protein ABB37_05212 [Leptomonas pyrrhocoris]|eukprot:XP_015658683.1 hypothetical protein ABB37_05212 [Leptomonas pyrrhocoris]
MAMMNSTAMMSNAVHLEDASRSPSLPSSSPLCDLLAADSVQDVLVYLSAESIAENPDARLRTFSDIVTHISARYTGDFSSSKANSFDLATPPSSQESAPPLEASRWKWADALMRGVTDPWSRIRAICLSPMADLLLSEVREVLALQRLAGGDSEQTLATLPERSSRLSYSAPGPSRRHSTDRSETDKKTGEAVKGGGRSLGDGKLHASPPTPLRKLNVSAPLDYLWTYWERTTRWYEHDGIVRLLVKVYGRSRTVPGAALRADEAGIRTLLFKVLFPAFRDPQLPVRESAAALLGVLVDRERTLPIPSAITSFIVEHIIDTLAQVPIPVRSRSPLTSSDQESTRVLEGNLLAVVVLVDMNVIQVASSSVMPLLLQLASYPASSVRQYIAQILRPPSPPVFVYLMQCLCEQDGQQTHRSETEDSDDAPDAADDDDDGEHNWQRQETVMMALQQHFLSLASTRATARDWLHASTCSNNVLELLRRATPLAVVFHAMQSPRFEVARMGSQLFPLLLQTCIRFLAPADLPRICEACCGAEGCMQDELNRLQAQGDLAAFAKTQLSIATVAMPALWFYLTIRRIEAEVTGRSRAGIEKVIRPYATYECVTFASQAHLREDAGNGNDAPASCALLVLAAYCACVMDPAEWHRCVEEVLKPSWWVELLSNPVRREQVRLGPDFVRAVHHCGTPAQSQRIVELIPTLTAALANAQTHQQCLIIAMIRGAVVGHAGAAAATEERAMAYVYHDVYAAPALTEGGEAAPLGHTWLKLFVPTHDAIPTAVLWGPLEGDGGNRDTRIVIRRDSDVFRALDEVCFKELFQSTKTELSVLRELHSLMISLTRLDVHARYDGNGKESDDQHGVGSDVDWCVLALESVFGRLDKVCPRWRERASDDAAAKKAPAEEEVVVAESDEICWDDWDDDEDDDDGCAQGIYEAEAIKSAVLIVSTLRELAATNSHDGSKTNVADERFRSELAALNIK